MAILDSLGQIWMDDKRLFNWNGPFRDGFQGGELVLRQMKIRIGLEIGDRLFFYGSGIAHEVMVVGNSIGLFTQTSNYELLTYCTKAVVRLNIR